jgi:hypothetical protein
MAAGHSQAPIGHPQRGVGAERTRGRCDARFMSDALANAQRGLEAWRRGDFEAIESMLDPAVQWHWFEPGEWDCRSRADVMQTLRERYEQGFARGSLDFVGTGRPESVAVVSHPQEIGGSEWPEETATVMRFDGDRVVEMQEATPAGHAPSDASAFQAAPPNAAATSAAAPRRDYRTLADALHAAQ